MEDNILDQGTGIDEGQVSPDTGTGSEGAEPQGNEPDPQGQTEPQGQQNYAFAQMRTENSKYKNFVSNIATQLGLDANTSTDDLSRQLEEASAAKLVQESGVNEALAKKIANIEMTQREITQREQTAVAQENLRAIQREFGESNEGMKDFVQKLEERGVDAFTANLRNEYIASNLDKIIESSVEAALKRQGEAANAPSGSPGAPVGHGGGSDNKVNSVADLTAIFKDLDI